MHRLIRNHIEDVLTASKPAAASGAASSEAITGHLQDCDKCREDVAAMKEHSRLMQEFKAPADIEPRPGFYARVMERIEAEGAGSIWNLFIESAFGRRIAVASFALALLLGIYVVSSERTAEQPIIAGQASGQITAPAPAMGQGATDQGAIGQGMDTPMVSNASAVVSAEDGPGQVLTQMDASSSEDDVLVNLVTYREQ